MKAERHEAAAVSRDGLEFEMSFVIFGAEVVVLDESVVGGFSSIKVVSISYETGSAGEGDVTIFTSNILASTSSS